jgi:HSP20 family protein
MESFFGDSLFAPAERNLGNRPAVNIRENKDVYLLEAELPGYDEKNIQVHVDGRSLTIESIKEEDCKKDSAQEGKASRKEEEPRFIVRERRLASFSRSFQLPEDADFEAITANFKNGLLTLEIRKRAETQKRVIEISRN